MGRRRGVFGSVYQRGLTWYIRYRSGANGVRGDSRIAVGPCTCPDPNKAHDCPVRAVAYATLARAQLNIMRDQHLGIQTVGKITLTDWIPKYAPHLRSRVKNRPDLVLGQLRRAAEHFGGRFLSEIGRADVEDFLLAIEAAGASPATQNRYLAALSPCFEAAVQRQYAISNPCSKVRRGREGKKAIPWVNPEELARIILATPAKYRAAVTVAAETGLRRGELVKLTARDVDLDRRVLLVRKGKNGDSREVDLTPAAVDALRGAPRSGPLFPGVTEGGLSKGFPKWAAAAEVPGLTLHGLRHVYCSHLAQAGVPLETVARLAGHKSISTTHRYSQYAPGTAAKSATAALAAARREKGSGKAQPSSGRRSRKSSAS